ncbi:APC family permease [Cryobacterium breve]|uniref:APC family permease n=1 Tax=Cryobacterium breve TaxID=1259258 RepID=UPI00248B15F3|nr:APC family permease [Cryobacterium breve]
MPARWPCSGSAPFFSDTAGISGISAGAAIAAYSFLGFDAVTTLTEETINPRKTMPRAIMLIALIGGAIFVLVAYTTTLVHPGGVFENSSSAAFDIALTIGGNVFGAIFIAGLVLGQFASGLAAQAGGARLLYAMGRDGVLPRRIFGAISERYRTPVISIVITGVVGLIALFLDVATSTSFINFGAFTAFTFVNLAVIAFFVRERKAGIRHNVWLYVVIPAIGAVVDAWLLTQLDVNAVTLGLVWLAVGVVVLAFLTKGFRKAPPELAFEEAEEAVLATP